MRDFQLQTPLRDQSSATRRSKSTPTPKRNLVKVSKKSLNPAFKAVAEDDSAVLESPKEVSDVYDDNPFGESDENFITLVDPEYTDSLETVAVSDLTSPALSSSAITSDKHVVINSADTKCGSPEVDSFNKVESVEADLVIKHLREARIQILESKDVGSSKKLMDALINIIIEEFYGGLYEENEWLDKFLSRKANLAFLSLMMVVYTMLMFWFFSPGVKGFPNELTPT